jgi:hypothetical protein
MRTKIGFVEICVDTRNHVNEWRNNDKSKIQENDNLEKEDRDIIARKIFL